jgi:hypothetical protein
MKALSVLEAWAQEVVEKVAKKSLVEDDFIEFKRTWIKPHKAARRIAAHANVARGQDILWLIGVDPDEPNPFFELPESKPEEWFATSRGLFRRRSLSRGQVLPCRLGRQGSVRDCVRHLRIPLPDKFKAVQPRGTKTGRCCWE